MRKTKAFRLTVPQRRVARGRFQMRTVTWLVLYLILIITIINSPVYAVETTGVIEGVVEDKTGAVLAGVTVTLVNEGTSERRELVTGSIGRFVFPDLPVGTYRITAGKDGFKTFTEIGILLRVTGHVA